MKVASLPSLSSLTLLALLGLPSIVAAQSLDSLDQRGRNILSVGVGLTGTRADVAAGSGVTAKATGEVASVAFTHYVRRSIAVEVSASLLDAYTSAAAGSAHDEAVMPFLIGVSIAPEQLALGTTLRPFFSIAAGPYVRMITQAAGPSGANTAESAIGAKVGAGADWFVARHVALRLAAGYHAVNGFEERPGAITKNATGFALSAGLGFAWGGAKHI